MTLKDGKNRHIRKVLQQLKLGVKKLIRIQYGPYTLKGIKPGDVKEVPLFGKLAEFRFKI